MAKAASRSTTGASRPVPYSPAVETPEPDEAETVAELIDTMREIGRTTYQDSGHANRSVHAKSHGILRGELRVLPDLPAELAQGLFAKPGSYDVVMRYSTIPGDILDDSIAVPRGLAIKIIGVEGGRLPGSEGATTQDVVLVNGPAFAAPDAKAFLKTLKLLAATTDTPQVLKKAVSALTRGAEIVVEAFGGESPTLKTLGGSPQTNLLGDTYFTQAPLRFGDYIAKLSLAPVSPGLTTLTDQPVSASGKPDALREAVNGFFRVNGGEWELRAQLCRNIETMPVEDSSVVWPEDESPYLPVGRISVSPQTAWSEARARIGDDALSFSPWHGLAAHQPLGSIMRARRPAYEMSARFRAFRNGVRVEEPAQAPDLPG